MHRDGQLRVQLQNLCQQLVRHFRGQNLQIGRSAPRLAHAERAALAEVEAVRGDIVLRPHARFGNVLPRKAERLPLAGVHLTVEHGQPLPPVEGLALYAQPLEGAHHVGLHPAQPGPGLAHAGGGQAEGDVFGAYNAVVALGDLAFEHIHILVPDAVKLVLLGGDIDLIPGGSSGTAVDERELERQGAVKVIEERAPAAENGGLILRGRHGVIDVLVFHRFGKDVARKLADAVRVHHHIGDRLLGRQRGPAVNTFGFTFGLCFPQQAPPFP